MSVSGFVGFLKGKSSQLIHEQHGNLKYKCKEYYVDATGKSTKRIAEYIHNQRKEEQVADQITMKKYADPFTGSKLQAFRKWQTIYMASGAAGREAFQAHKKI